MLSLTPPSMCCSCFIDLSLKKISKSVDHDYKGISLKWMHGCDVSDANASTVTKYHLPRMCCSCFLSFLKKMSKSIDRDCKGICLKWMQTVVMHWCWCICIPNIIDLAWVVSVLNGLITKLNVDAYTNAPPPEKQSLCLAFHDFRHRRDKTDKHIKYAHKELTTLITWCFESLKSIALMIMKIEFPTT